MIKLFSFKSDATRQEKLVQVVLILIWLLLAAGYVYKALNASLHLVRSGDEGFFLKELDRFRADGLWQSFADGISYMHVLLVSALAALVGSPLLAGRLLNLLLLPLALYLGSRIMRNTGVSGMVFHVALVTLAYMLVFCQTGKMFYRFLSDPLMLVLAMLSICFMQEYFLKGKTGSLVIAALTAGMTLWVRSFAVLIMAGLVAHLLWNALLSKPRGKVVIGLFIFVVLALATALVVQIPSLAEGNGLSFENKSGDGNWAERNWLTRLNRQSNGSVFSYVRISWEDVELYKQAYGEDSIPKSLVEIAKHDPKFLVDNIVSNLFIRAPFVMSISAGLFFLLFLDLMRKPGWLWRKSALEANRVFFWVAASVSLGLSLIIINYIEHRWLFLAAFCVLTLGAIQLERPRLQRARKPVMLTQSLFLALLSAGELLMAVIRGF
ncbi:MAG TPA: hypothetical protein PLM19_01780 [Candidatus Syntrophosphaera sp.]|nr:hypothetical protein [Candidatus Cloacimonadota bacterium]HOR02718.1 hypothetical protein [Candidatus Syntrophosphaera sp.]